MASFGTGAATHSLTFSLSHSLTHSLTHFGEPLIINGWLASQVDLGSLRISVLRDHLRKLPEHLNILVRVLFARKLDVSS